MDPYSSLRPPEPYQELEPCSCSDLTSVMIYAHFSANPMVCLKCSGEVPPERIPLQPDFAHRLGRWAQFQDAFDTLWIQAEEDEELENLARRVQENFNSPLNRRGYALAQELNSSIGCHYFFFYDVTGDEYPPPKICPNCSGMLEPIEIAEGFRRKQVCQPCKIVL